MNSSKIRIDIDFNEFSRGELILAWQNLKADVSVSFQPPIICPPRPINLVKTYLDK